MRDLVFKWFVGDGESLIKYVCDIPTVHAADMTAGFYSSQLVSAQTLIWSTIKLLKLIFFFSRNKTFKTNMYICKDYAHVGFIFSLFYSHEDLLNVRCP